MMFISVDGSGSAVMQHAECHDGNSCIFIFILTGVRQGCIRSRDKLQQEEEEGEILGDTVCRVTSVKMVVKAKNRLQSKGGHRKQLQAV